MARRNANGGGTRLFPRFSLPVYTFGAEFDSAVTPHTQHQIRTMRPHELAAAAAGCALFVRDARTDPDPAGHDRALVRIQLITAELARRLDPDNACIKIRPYNPMPTPGASP